MAEVPFLGCKISLISKCDIRYEGILYCVDAKESTIALSKVKSYGTEDRADPNSGSWVAPKNEVYDIIIFRASDVKDLRVDTPEPPGLSDPAIISAHQHAYPSGGNGPSSAGTLGNPAGSSSSSSAATANVNKSNHQASASAVSSSQSAAAAMAAGARIASKQVLDAYGSPTNNISSGPASSKQQHKPLLPFLPTGETRQAKDSTFQLAGLTASSNHNQQPPINYSSAAANGQRRSRPEPREKKSTSEDSSHHHQHASSINAQNSNQNHKKVINHHHDDRNSVKENRDDRRNHRGVSSDRRSDKRGAHGGDHDNHHYQQRSYHHDRRDDRRHRDDNRQKNDDRRDDRKGSRDRRRGSSNPRVSRGYDRSSNYVSNSRPGGNGDRGRYQNDMRRRGPNDSNRGYRKPGGDGRPPFRRGPMQGNRRPRSGDRIPGQGYRGPRKSAPLKFEGEYDFDEANKEFLELEAKLKNLKLKNGNESKDGDKLSTDEQVNSKSPMGDSESGSSYDSEDHHTNKNDDSNDETNGAEFYDKTKSFFDTISCEASERSSGKVGKPDWRKERQLNAETFGVSANYRRGGGYRGRAWQANTAR